MTSKDGFPILWRFSPVCSFKISISKPSLGVTRSQQALKLNFGKSRWFCTLSKRAQKRCSRQYSTFRVKTSQIKIRFASEACNTSFMCCPCYLPKIRNFLQVLQLLQKVKKKKKKKFFFNVRCCKLQCDSSS